MGQVLRQEEYSEQINYLDILHSDSKGWITRAEINCGYKQWHYRYNELLEQDFNQENVYTVSYTNLRAQETVLDKECRLML